MKHICPECLGDGHLNGYTCPMCSGTTQVSHQDWEDWVDEQQKTMAEEEERYHADMQQQDDWLNDYELRKAGWWPE